MKRLILSTLTLITCTAASANDAIDRWLEKHHEDLACLAKNIHQEAGIETHEGRLAVAFGTLYRVQSPLYPNTICGVVYQRNQMSWTKVERKVNAKIPDEFVILAYNVMTGKYKDKYSSFCKPTNWYNAKLDSASSFNARQFLKGKAKCSYTLTSSAHTFIEFVN